ncbi:MAG: hypothetical protein HDQ87_12090 [Clostridia bacterium]|nr:hypothetical protein [Clostridia bacterium]MBD5561063.1 hypothetical protein [Clostridia bacterium]
METQQATREEMIQEAVGRMQAAGLPVHRIEHFEREGQRLLAEDLPQGKLVLSSGDGRLSELADRVEEKTGGVIYAAHLAHAFPFGRTTGFVWTLFGVMPDRQDWEQEERLAKAGRQNAFVVAPGLAGFEEVPVKVVQGAMVRTEDR